MFVNAICLLVIAWFCCVIVICCFCLIVAFLVSLFDVAWLLLCDFDLCALVLVISCLFIVLFTVVFG